MNKISDFKIAYIFIKKACELKNKGFVDLPVVFFDQNESYYDDGKIIIGKTTFVGETITKIVMSYLSNFAIISDSNSANATNIFINEEQKNMVYTSIASFFRFLTFSQNAYTTPKSEKAVVKRLFHKPFVWTMMRDFVCPCFNSYPVKNTRVIEILDPQTDICFLSEDEKNDEKIIILNKDIEYEPCVDAHLFFCAIEAQGLDAEEVISKIFDSQLKSIFMDVSDIAYETSSERPFGQKDFISFLLTIAEYKNVSEELIYEIANRNIQKIGTKTAQHQNPALNISDTFWFLGLIEKMLEPARGPDWETYKHLHPYFEELWGKIEKERKKRGRRGLSYEALLRIKDGENDPSKVAILEKTLSSDRVW